MPIKTARSYYAILYARQSRPFPGGHLQIRSRRMPSVGAINAWLIGPKSQLPARYQSEVIGSDLEPETKPKHTDQ